MRTLRYIAASEAVRSYRVLFRPSSALWDFPRRVGHEPQLLPEIMEPVIRRASDAKDDPDLAWRFHCARMPRFEPDARQAS
jgi:hypothetical protein